MAEPLGHDLDRYARLQQQRRHGMPGAMHLDRAYASGRDDLPEVTPRQRAARLPEDRGRCLQVRRF